MICLAPAEERRQGVAACLFSPAGRRCRQADEGASADRSECAERERRVVKGVPCGPLIRPSGPPTGVEPEVSTRPSDPRWGE
ncbi:hypothetical protein CO659_10570 [Rhizobium sp. S9]|nr:hypothetical protein CO659_10570 [Rhizobium sp. S9]